MMLVNLIPSRVTASAYLTSYEPYYMPYRIIDGTTDPWALPQNVTTGWIAFEFSAPVVAKTYQLTGQVGYPSRSPYSWRFEGLVGGSVWKVLDTRVAVSGWEDSKFKCFSFPNVIAYSAYRLNITAGISSEWMTIGEIKMLGPRQSVDRKSLLTLPSVSRL